MTRHHEREEAIERYQLFLKLSREGAFYTGIENPRFFSHSSFLLDMYTKHEGASKTLKQALDPGYEGYP